MLNLLKNARGRSVVAALCVAVALITLPACGSRRPTGKVAGKVVYQGKAVTAGEVTFHDKTRGVAATAKLDAAGAFEFAQPLEYGVYAVMVTPAESEPGDPRKGTSTAVNRVNLPRKTRDLMTSGLSFEVNQKSHEFNVVLSD